MCWICFGVVLVATFALYAALKYLLKSPTANGPYLRSCLKKPAKEPELAKPRILDSVNGYVKKAILVLTGKRKKVRIQASPTRSRVVVRWIDKKKHCFHREKKRRRAPKRW